MKYVFGVNKHLVKEILPAHLDNFTLKQKMPVHCLY